VNRRDRVLTALAGGAIGALFFVWIAGARVVTPTEVSWTMQSDWRNHYLGWHFFRHEPWQWPPGRIDSYFEPIGTSVGFTDSIPVVAFALKPLSALLPSSFQYLGLWLLLCFTLQGVFGVLVMRLWTPSILQQLLGATCYVLVPTLLMRVGHPALCSHWLLLWALWLYLRADRLPRAALGQTATLAFVGSLVHPYLALMVAGVLSALGLRLLVVRRMLGVATIGIVACCTLAGWWLSGLFTISGIDSLAAAGLTTYSMNLLGPIAPAGWSTLLPDMPLAGNGQLFEGFQYLGAGLLFLMLVGVIARLAIQGGPVTKMPWPLFFVVALFAICSLGPQVTVGATVLAHIEHAWIDRLEVFHALGRFFWPAAYVLLTMALAVIVSRLTPRPAIAVLCAAVVLQMVDLRDAHAFRRRVSRDEAFYAWRSSLTSPAWARLLPEYRHLVLYPPSYCGPVPVVDLESVAHLAGLHGLTLNGGLAARVDESRRRAACREIADTLTRGDVDHASIYIGRPGEIDVVKLHAKQPMVCGVIDAVGVCATARSYERWREAAHLE
jgi:hypothetical protein